MKRIKKIINRIPVDKVLKLSPLLVLILTTISIILKGFDIYPKLYEYLSQIIGYSIMYNIVFYRYAILRGFSSYCKFSILSLLTLNIVALIALIFSVEEYFLYVVVNSVLAIALIVITFSELLKIIDKNGGIN